MTKKHDQKSLGDWKHWTVGLTVFGIGVTAFFGLTDWSCGTGAPPEDKGGGVMLDHAGLRRPPTGATVAVRIRTQSGRSVKARIENLDFESDNERYTDKNGIAQVPAVWLGCEILVECSLTGDEIIKLKLGGGRSGVIEIVVPD